MITRKEPIEDVFDIKVSHPMNEIKVSVYEFRRIRSEGANTIVPLDDNVYAIMRGNDFRTVRVVKYDKT